MYGAFFQAKSIDICLISHKNIVNGGLVEATCQGTFNEYPQHNVLQHGTANKCPLHIFVDKKN